MRRAAKRDATEPDIIAAFKVYGYKVRVIREGMGMADLLVKSPDGRTDLVECKAPHGSLTPEQVAFFASWGDVAVIASPEEAAKWIITHACRRPPHALES